MPEEPDIDFDALPPGTRVRVIGVIFFAVAIALTLVYLLSGGGAQLFHKKIHLHAYLSDGAGLDSNSPVRLNGVRVGQTTSVKLSGSHNPTRAVRADMEVDRLFKTRIPADSIAALTADNLLGDKYVNITVGKSKRHVEDDTEIASLIQNGAFDPADLIASLRTTLTRVDAIITEIDKGNSPLAQFVKGEDLYDNIRGQIAGIQKTITLATSKNSETGQALLSADLYDEIRQPILNVDRMLEQIQRGETAVGRFVNSSATYDNAVVQVRNIHQSIRDARSGKGSELLTSDDKYRQIQAKLESINQQIDLLTTGDKGFAKYLASRELYDSLNGTSRKSRDFLRQFRQNPQKFLRIKAF